SCTPEIDSPLVDEMSPRLTAAVPPTGPGGQARPLRVVVADADPAVCQLYDQALPALGHQVCVAQSGRQLVELCRAVRPDLVVADFRLPDLDGIRASAEACREHPAPVILTSECPATDLAGRANAGHVLAYL